MVLDAQLHQPGNQRLEHGHRLAADRQGPAQVEPAEPHPIVARPQGVGQGDGAERVITHGEIDALEAGRTQQRFEPLTKDEAVDVLRHDRRPDGNRRSVRRNVGDKPGHASQ